MILIVLQYVDHGDRGTIALARAAQSGARSVIRCAKSRQHIRIGAIKIDSIQLAHRGALITAKELLGVGEDQSILIDPIEAADGIVRLGLNASDDFLGLPVHNNQYNLAIELRSRRDTLT